VAIGTVTTGLPGTSAVVTNVGTANAAILNITIPAGESGLDGATPTGLTFSQNGLDITDGLVQQMPSWWPPVISFNPTSASADGITLVFNKNANGEVQVTVSAATLLANIAVEQATQNTNITTLTTTIATLQAAHDALQAAHNTLKARVDAAGIP
jgi:hypothetical protein